MLLTFLLCSIGLATAQNSRTITGTVFSGEENEPIIGASVLVVGTTNGTITDFDGKFTLKVSATDKWIEVSYLGMQTKRVDIRTKNSFKVVLESDTELLDEVVVTGYGSAKKLGSVVGSVSTVKTEKIAKKPVANVADALQGQVAGLQVFTSSGEPSAGVSMRIRGVSSISAGTAPLFILDGAPISSGAFSCINSNDIESLTVLKDAASTAIYGSRAANGVVIITTKRGLRGTKPSITFSAQYGVSDIAGKDRMDMMNAQQWFSLQEMISPSLLTDQDFQDKKNFYNDNNISTNWADEYLGGTAPTSEFAVTMTGGSEMSSYFISANHYQADGLMDDSDMRRENFRFRLDTNISKNLKSGVNLALSYRKINQTAFGGSGNSVFNKAFASRINSPIETEREILRDEDGNFIGWGPRKRFYDIQGHYNPRYLSELQPNPFNQVRINATTYFQYKPIQGLTLRAQQALEAYDNRTSYRAIPEGGFMQGGKWYDGPFEKIDGYKGSGGTASQSFSRNYQFTYTNTIEYKFDINRNHHFTALVGQESIISKYHGFSASVSELADPNFVLLSAASKATKIPSESLSDQVVNSFFSTFSYNYGDKYFLDASFRRDGSSIFAKDNRWANFWSLGGMWNLKQESFLKNVRNLDDLAIKLSYGTTGNSAIAPYQALDLVAAGTGYNGEPGSWIVQMPNPALSWETSKTWNFGFSGAAFKNLINWDIQLYKRTTEDMLMSVPISMTQGFSSAKMNIASLENRGIELTLGSTLVNTKDWNVSASLNVGYNENEVTSLFGGIDEYALGGTGLKMKVGEPYGEYYYVRWDGVDPQDGNNVWLDKNGNKTKVYSDDYKVMTGKQQYAPWEGGFGFHAMYKGFYLDLNFSGIFDRYVVNNERYFTENPTFASKNNQTVRMLDMWTTPGQKTDIPRIDAERQFDSHLLEDASFVRLKNMSLGYMFSQKALEKIQFLKSAKVYFTGRNVYTFTSFKGYDPEINSNMVMGAYPNTRQLMFGFELSF